MDLWGCRGCFSCGAAGVVVQVLAGRWHEEDGNMYGGRPGVRVPCQPDVLERWRRVARGKSWEKGHTAMHHAGGLSVNDDRCREKEKGRARPAEQRARARASAGDPVQVVIMAIRKIGSCGLETQISHSRSLLTPA